VLTSLECVLKGEGVEDAEAFLRACRKTPLILIESDEYDFSLLIGIHLYMIIQV
jgi:hypothetical protein